ncbi:MAG: Gfo/Idh/MocA family oxidoreductase [Armatimonadota bacterium]|nr:Gfo/Idh/MocA family oxidoreductase [Armatimonadota bacterium]MCX7777150.1 Gfo/Idh/MocA family oxidoreductase [Armatimonadota bacterium]MDW8025198.1 Gfo/Idh/MocA family oxidoreductase [Armatimonadota bacterium]
MCEIVIKLSEVDCSVSEIGFAVVGLGMGAVRARTIASTHGARLVAVADIREDKARAVASELSCDAVTDYRKLLERDDVDVVMVMTPSGMHAEVAVDALNAGKHVIVTKPMEVTLERAEMMIQAAERNNRLLAVDFEARYYPSMVRIKRAIDDGMFGKLILAEARLKWYRSQEYYSASGWRGTWRYDGGGSLSNQTIHLIDLLLWFISEVEEVQAAHIGIYAHEIETEDLGIAMLKFKSGAVGTIVGTTTFPQDAYSGIEIHGTDGGVIAHVFVGDIERWFFRDATVKPPDVQPRVKNVIEDVVSALLHGTSVAVDGKEGKRSLELLTAIYMSAMQNRSVRLSELNP